jgi:hypothetical protein
MEPRLKSGIWVRALIRRCAVEAVPALVVRKGDESAGGIFVKVNRLDGQADVFSPARRGDGSKVWMHVLGPDPVPEADADAYIARQVKFDPDVWVVEIEDREGRHFLGEEVDLGGGGLIP